MCVGVGVCVTETKFQMNAFEFCFCNCLSTLWSEKKGNIFWTKENKQKKTKQNNHYKSEKNKLTRARAFYNQPKKNNQDSWSKFHSVSFHFPFTFSRMSFSLFLSACSWWWWWEIKWSSTHTTLVVMILMIMLRRKKNHSIFWNVNL